MDITVILPLHKYTEEYDQMLFNAVGSIKYSGKDKEVSLIVVSPNDVYEQYKNIDKKSVKHVNVSNGESTEFQHLVNKGVSECKTEYFSVIEVDDKFNENAFSNFKKYSEGGFDASITLFLTEAVDYDTAENGSIGYINEAVWARGFSEENGRLDFECIKDFFAFNLTGSIIKKSDYLSIGGLKESIKMSFWYEFMLRAIHNGLTTFVIPKVGYFHTINRPDSLIDICDKNVPQEEAEWWVELARKEYFYKDDRNKTFE